jgi:hypothetical protein
MIIRVTIDLGEGGIYCRTVVPVPYPVIVGIIATANDYCIEVFRR